MPLQAPCRLAWPAPPGRAVKLTEPVVQAADPDAAGTRPRRAPGLPGLLASAATFPIMAQVFSPFSVLVIKFAWIAVLVAVVAAIAIYRWRAGFPDARGAPVAQPIPFSHKHHVGDDGIDCRYCHTTVEKSRFAGLPSTEVCLTCHSQLFRDAPLLMPLQASAAAGRPLRWRRVHDLPDFVYFDHGIHVAKGVSCGECHGPVDQMPLTWRQAPLEMQWCLDCHRAPEARLHPPGEVFSAARNGPTDARRQEALARAYGLQSRRRLTDCSTCHR